MELTLAQRNAVTKAQLSKWPKATKAEKSAILDAVCQVTGWHRDHARKAIRIALLNQARGGPPPRAPRLPAVVYGEEVIALLTRCWGVLDGPAGKRLRPALADTLANMDHHGRLSGPERDLIPAVLAMSAATIDRRLAAARQGRDIRKPISHTRPGSMLKTSIPMKTWAEWDDTAPGFLQIDLVGHDGGDNNGQFAYSLDATDIATGWTESVTVRSKGEKIVAAGLQDLQLRFPFHIAGIHSDNGSEFINHHLARWCNTRQITFTRGRSHHSNDQAHVEQKNWTVVRRNAGYFRYDTPWEIALLNQMWPLVSLLGNLFQPQQKLIGKTRTGAIVRKKHDTAATPLRRLLDRHADYLDPHDQATLEANLLEIDLVDIRQQILDIQGNLIDLARRRGPVPQRAKRNATYLNRTKIGPPPTRAPTDESTNHTTRAS